MDTCRLFIAIPLPERVKDALERAQGELRAGLAGSGVRWARRAQFHVTLKFLGEVDTNRVDALAGALGRACRGAGDLPLRARSLGVFPSHRRPRVIWVGVDDGRGQLQRLQRAVEAAAADFTSEGPDGTFTGHVTLARCKTIAPSQVAWLAARAAVMENRPFGAWTADTVELVRSEPGPDGSRYTTLSVIPLACPDVPPEQSA